MKDCMIYSIVALLLHFLQCHAGDPCPRPQEIGVCTCSQRRVTRSVEVSSLETSAVDTNKSLEMGFIQSSDDLIGLPFASSDPISMGPKPLITVVECDMNKSVIALEEAVVLGLHRKLVDKLTVRHLLPLKEGRLVKLPSRWLKNTRVKQIEILDSILSGDFIWSGEPFEGQEQSLIALTVNRCFLYGALTYDSAGTVNLKTLDRYSKIELLDFSNNHLAIISANAFHKPPANLSTLNLSFNTITTIEANAFKSISILKTIDLSHNLLEKLTRNIFAAPAKRLHTLNLSWNFLKELPADFFTNMPALKNVNLAKNFLYTLSDKPWTVVWHNLTMIDLTNNFINCDCNLMWLLSNNSSTHGRPQQHQQQQQHQSQQHQQQQQHQNQQQHHQQQQQQQHRPGRRPHYRSFNSSELEEDSENDYSDLGAVDVKALSLTDSPIRGECLYYQIQPFVVIKHKLHSLTIENLMCNMK